MIIGAPYVAALAPDDDQERGFRTRGRDRCQGGVVDRRRGDCDGWTARTRGLAREGDRDARCGFGGHDDTPRCTGVEGWRRKRTRHPQPRDAGVGNDETVSRQRISEIGDGARRMQRDLLVEVSGLCDCRESRVQIIRDRVGRDVVTREGFQFGRRDDFHRCECEAIGRRLALVDSRRHDEVGAPEAEQLKVTRLEPAGSKMVRAVPCEDTLGAPRVRDTQLTRGGEVAQAVDRVVVDDSWAREHDDATTMLGHASQGTDQLPMMGPAGSLTTVTSEVLALDGRALGKRGAATRRRLLDATAKLLETHGVRDLRVVDIAREVGTSPATFYQYFREVEDAVLALSAEVGEDLAPLKELLARPWDDERGLASARELVDAFVGYWDTHRAVLRTRNLAAQEGDQRFRDSRNKALRPLREGLARKVEDAQRNGRVASEITPMAAAAALAAMMERMAAFHVELEMWGVERTDLVETTARIVYQTVTGEVR